MVDAIDLIGIAGVVFVVAGVGLIYPPGALILIGCLLMAGAVYLAQASKRAEE